MGRRRKTKEIFRKVDRTREESPDHMTEIVSVQRRVIGRLPRPYLELEIDGGESFISYESISIKPEENGYLFTYEAMLPMASETFLSRASRRYLGKGKLIEKIRDLVREGIKKARPRKGYTPLISVSEHLEKDSYEKVFRAFYLIQCYKAGVPPASLERTFNP